MCTRVTVANPSARRDVNIERFCKIMVPSVLKQHFFNVLWQIWQKLCPSIKKKEMVNDYGK